MFMMRLIGFVTAIMMAIASGYPPHSAGESDKPMIALTFDDGPSRYTEYILDLLEEHGGQATFFVLGYRVMPHRSTVQRTIDIGSEVLGHTWSHRQLTRLSEEQLKFDLRRTSAVIEALTGIPQYIYRPPYGAINDEVLRVSEELGYSVVLWTVDTLDWRYRCAETIYNAVMDGAQDGAVVLMHDIRQTTAQAMRYVIPRLIEEGFRLVTVSEILYHVYGELEPGRIYMDYRENRS